jgi:hypothetical protein
MLYSMKGANSFDPKTVRLLGAALDTAWERLRAKIYLNGGSDDARTILAQQIIAMAKQGERDPERFSLKLNS